MGNDQSRMCASLWEEGGEAQQASQIKKKSKRKKRKPSENSTGTVARNETDSKSTPVTEDNDNNNNNNDDNNNSNNSEGAEIDIDLNDPEVEKAAIKIQSVFRGFAARKEHKKLGRRKDSKAFANRQWEREEDNGELGGADDYVEPGAAPPAVSKKSNPPPANKPQPVKQSPPRYEPPANNNSKPNYNDVPNGMPSAAVVDTPPLSYRSSADKGVEVTSGSVMIELNSFQGLDKARNVYVVFDIEELDDSQSSQRQERRSKTMKSLEPRWDEQFEPLPVEDIRVQALRINLYEKRTMRKDVLLGFADIDLRNLSPDVIGEVETELENSKHQLWGLLTLTVQFLPQ